MTDPNAISKLNLSKERYLSFSLGTEEFAIPLLSVKEAIALPEITPIPYSPSHFLGVINLRGQVISIIDLRLKFNIKPQNSQEKAVIICDLQSSSLGIVVDSINSVLTPAVDEISDRPEMHENRNVECITGIYRKSSKLILLLDVAKALNLEDRAALTRAASASKAAA